MGWQCLRGFERQKQSVRKKSPDHFWGPLLPPELGLAPCRRVFLRRLIALDLCELISGIDGAERGRSSELNIRTALHAGPVFQLLDPITGDVDFFGSHVNQTARIQPITPPGNVYASEPFVALAESESIQEFFFEYVGLTKLAKDYGTLPMYGLLRAIPELDSW